MNEPLNNQLAGKNTERRKGKRRKKKPIDPVASRPMPGGITDPPPFHGFVLQPGGMYHFLYEGKPLACLYCGIVFEYRKADSGSTIHHKCRDGRKWNGRNKGKGRKKKPIALVGPAWREPTIADPPFTITCGMTKSELIIWRGCQGWYRDAVAKCHVTNKELDSDCGFIGPNATSQRSREILKLVKQELVVKVTGPCGIRMTDAGVMRGQEMYLAFFRPANPPPTPREEKQWRLAESLREAERYGHPMPTEFVVLTSLGGDFYKHPLMDRLMAALRAGYDVNKEIAELIGCAETTLSDKRYEYHAAIRKFFEEEEMRHPEMPKGRPRHVQRVDDKPIVFGTSDVAPHWGTRRPSHAYLYSPLGFDDGPSDEIRRRRKAAPYEKLTRTPVGDN